MGFQDFWGDSHHNLIMSKLTLENKASQLLKINPLPEEKKGTQKWLGSGKRQKLQKIQTREPGRSLSINQSLSLFA